MERQVFVSHAAEDPDWPVDAVEAVAEAIRDAGIAVHLDLWHRRAKRRELSLGEWRAWMDAAVHGASHILCLVSPRYLRLWERRAEEAGGFGVAFESIRMIHGLYLQKQHNDGRIFTLRPEALGFDCIPPDLAYDCPAYRWPAARGDVISHVAEADLPAFARARAGVGASPAPESRSEPAQPSQAAPPAPPPIPAAAPASARAQSSAPAATPSPSRAENATPSWASASGQDDYGRWADLTVHGVTQRMRWIPPTGPEGFWMGSSAAERAAITDKDARDWANKTEHAPRREHLQAGFWLADTPCTQAFWRAVADIDPSHFSAGPEAPQRPVESVSWDEVMQQFIARLAERQGWGAEVQVALPTELEWEYAARAGTTTAYWWGDDWDAARGNADVTGTRKLEDKEGTTPVKRYPANPWGLYDVHGNVWEWCEDECRERPGAPEARQDLEWRVVRGGSWFAPPGGARAAFRGWRHRGNALQYQGFRFALRSPAGPEGR